MTINERVKMIRKAIGLNQTSFGKRIAIAQGYLTNIENGRRDVTEKTLKLICLEFNVNESWLRTGEGEMFNQPETFSLDKYAADHHLTALELDIVREYMSMDEDTRKVIMDKITSVVKRHIEAETAAALADNEIDIDKAVENYRRELESEKTSPTSQALPNTNIAG